MWSRSGFFVGPAAASGLKPLRRFPCLDLRTFLFRVRFFLKPPRTPSLRDTPQDHPNAGNQTSRPQIENAGRTRDVRGRAWGRKRQHHAQAGADVRHPQEPRDRRDRHHRRRRRRGSLRRLRLPPLARCELPARPRRHLRLALADPPLRPAHRRHHRRPHPQPQGRRTLFCAAEGQHAQFRRPGKGQAQGQFRQPHAAVSRISVFAWRSTTPREKTFLQG